MLHFLKKSKDLFLNIIPDPIVQVSPITLFGQEQKLFSDGKLLKHFLACRLFFLTVPSTEGNEAAEKEVETAV